MSLPAVLVPGLNCSLRLYEPQLPDLWRIGPVAVADHRRDETMAGIAARILAEAPPRFALAGLSMGGYIAFEMVRQAPARIAGLALLDTSARPETPEQTSRRRAQIALAREGRFGEIAEQMFAVLSRAAGNGDPRVQQFIRAMADDTGPEAFVRQQTAIMGRPDSRPTLATIRCPTLVVVGDDDKLTPPELAVEMAQGIAGARLKVVPECGHLSTLDQPQRLTALLASWLRDLG
jgi:pimeloyl-ACP methyl ester carboxylesterase